MRKLSAAALLLILVPAARVWAINADSADDICAPGADPCVVSQDFDIVDGSTLDFGTRTLQITVNGVLDTNTGEATILCGSFLTDAGTVPALKVRGADGLGGIDGGTLTLEARKHCSLDNARTCISDANCNFGTCTLKVCSGDLNAACVSDENCSYGTCDLSGAQHRCTGNSNRACELDGDCQFGTCTVNVCSTNKSEQCGGDNECDFGTCSVGTATFQTLRPIAGNGGTPGSLFVRAADDVTIGGSVTFNSTDADSDGGIVDIESGLGSVTVNASIEAKGGSFSTGGEICLISGEDVAINAAVDAGGGDFDGGFIEFDADRDIILNQSVRANSNGGGGFGGEIALAAINNITANAPTTFETNGHFAPGDNFGGDGGSIELSADQALSVGTSVALTSNGAEPDGFGGEILLESGAAMVVAGSASAKTSDAAFQGAGGTIDLDASGGLTFPAGALLDARGAENGGGAISIVTDGPMTFGGTIDARTSNNGSGDSIDLDIGGNVVMTGTMRISGTPESGVNGQVDFEFCRLTMQSGALIENAGGSGKNNLRARERVTINNGASVLASGANGVNRLIYRDPAKPPVISGTVSPAAAANDVNPFLVGCPVCGNGEIDGGETCEDGNTTGGDGCSADCQDEACIAQTPGFPEVPLCSDGDGCTLDVCESSTCQHQESCDDGLDCTNDSCNAQNTCAHTVNDALCDDDNPCTTDVCSLGARACVSVNNSNTCDDGVACTDNDHCGNAVCAGVSTCTGGQVCNPSTGQCQQGGICGDSNVDGTEQCDDGDAVWAVGQSCDAGCQLVACGDPDDNGEIRSSDALFILRTAVGTSSCDNCVCNVDSSTGTPVTASDSLRVLRKAVGNVVDLLCPACP